MKFMFWQMAMLMVIYVFSYVGYLIVDITFDGKFDMPINWGLIILMIIMGFGTMFYYMTRKAHMYVR